MDKVKVSREVAEALQYVNEEAQWNISVILEQHIEHGWRYNETKALNSLTPEKLARALILGYEIEKTPEEQIHERVMKSQRIIEEYQALDLQIQNKGFIEGVKFTLDTLGIEIEGVNLDE